MWRPRSDELDALADNKAPIPVGILLSVKTSSTAVTTGVKASLTPRDVVIWKTT